MRNLMRPQALIVLVAALACNAWAQRLSGEESAWAAFEASVKAAGTISFDRDLKEPGLFTSWKNQPLKPPGAGPFPAVVLLPSCAGVNAALIDRAKEFLKAGYAVLAVDPFDARRMPNAACARLLFPLALDAQKALAHLQQFEAIDKKRIFAVGYSTGGIAAMWSGSPHLRKEGGTELKYTAAATHYANCVYQDAPNDPRFAALRKDLDQPVLMLIAETDLPVANCTPLLDELKASGKPVEWHVMAGAAHLWDRPDDTRGSRVNGFGQTITLRYSPLATEEATRRTLEYFGRFK